MRFSHFFIDRPIFSSVFTIFIVIAGLLAYAFLPLSQYPEISPPHISISATYPGADALTVADTVAAPIEQELNGLEHLTYISSVSTNSGSLNIQLTYKLGTDLDIANVLVQNRLSTVMPRLPQEVRTLGITVRNANSDILMIAFLSSPNRAYDYKYLANYAYLTLRDPILRLEGVGDIRFVGGSNYAERIWVDPQKLTLYNLSIADVTKAITEQNIQFTGGTLNGEPSSQHQVYQFQIQSKGRLSENQDFENIIVRSQNGRILRLKDIAKIELGLEDYSTQAQLNGDPAVGMMIFQRPGTNAINAANQVKQTLEKLSKRFPADIRYSIPHNTMEFVEASLHEVYKTLFEAMILVVIVILVFLQSWRATLIPLITIPVSLIGTFAVMQLMGFSLNILSLLGLVLVIGIVVDDAIVVVENVERHMASGLSSSEAAHRTMREVGSALVAIALVLSSVFIPAAFVGGITGTFYKQFAVTIAAATILSAINSLTLTPALAKLFLRHTRGSKISGVMIVEHFLRGLRLFGNWFNGVFERFEKRYENFLKRLFNRTMLSYEAFGLYALIMLGIVFLFIRVPGGFIPEQDQGYMMAVMKLPQGATLSRTGNVVSKAIPILNSTEGVKSIVTFTGYNLTTGSDSSDSASFFIILKPFEERYRKGLTVWEMQSQITKKLSAIHDGTAIVFVPPPVRGLGTMGGFNLMLESLTSEDLSALARTSQDFIKTLNANPNIKQAYTTFTSNTPGYYIEINRTIAQMLKINLSTLFKTLSTVYGSSYINDMNLFARTYQVKLQGDVLSRESLDALLKLRVTTEDGSYVPLGVFAKVRPVLSPLFVQRYNLHTATPIYGDATNGVSLLEATKVVDGLQSQLPEGYAAEWTGLAYEQNQGGNTGIYVFILGILFVFLILAAQYESWLLPLGVIMAVPTGLLGALLAIDLTGNDNNILAQVGFLILIGLSSKNAILIVEYAHNIEFNEGLDLISATLKACRLRLRPIIMTALAFIAGSLPLIFSSGPGSEMRTILGLVVVFGMSVSTTLGLIITPIFYVLIRRLSWKAVKASVCRMLYKRRS